MRGLPAHCPNCDVIFESGAIGGGGGAEFFTSGGKSKCPRCGNYADVAEGKFRLEDDQVKVISGSKWSRTQAEAINRVFRDIVAKQGVDEGVIDALDKINPQLGEAARTATGKHGKGIAAAFIVLAVLSRCSVNVNLDVDLNELVNGEKSSVVEINTKRPPKPPSESAGRP